MRVAGGYLHPTTHDAAIAQRYEMIPEDEFYYDDSERPTLPEKD